MKEYVHCFACGSAVKRVVGDLIPMCASCRSGGPHLLAEDKRWMLRPLGAREQGPLPRAVIFERLMQEKIQPNDLVARVDGKFEPLRLHRDFRGIYIPGGAENLELERLRKAAARKVATKRMQEIGRVAGALAIGAFGVLTPWFTTTHRALVLPESVLVTIEGWMQDTREVRAEVDLAEVDEAVDTTRDLPGASLIEVFSKIYSDNPEPFELLMVRGEVALWEVTPEGAQRARESFERALVLNPRDPEAAGGLARAYAQQLSVDEDLKQPMLDLVKRVATLAPESVESYRTEAAIYLASEHMERALQSGKACMALTTEGTPDVACALFAARASNDDGALRQLQAEHPDSVRIALARGESLLASKSWGAARAHVREVTDRWPQMPAAWAVRARVGAETADWNDAIESAGRAVKLAPGLLEIRLLHGDLFLMIAGRPADALAEYQALMSNERWPTYTGKLPAYVNAAAAATQLKQWDLALQYADAALELDPGNPAASIWRAHALVAKGKDTDALVALGKVKSVRIAGEDGARFHAGAAAVHVLLKRYKEANDSMELAIELDPAWPDYYLGWAESRMGLGDAQGAFDKIREVALLDASVRQSRSPLVETWIEPFDLVELRNQVKQAVNSDARLQPDLNLIEGIVMWQGGKGQGYNYLSYAASESDDLAAHAALAQLHMDRRNYGLAIREVDQVIARRQNQPLFLGIRAQAFALMDNDEQAREAFAAALAVSDAVAAPQRWYAMFLLKSGDTEGAAKALEKAVAISPSDLQTRATLINVYELGVK